MDERVRWRKVAASVNFGSFSIEAATTIIEILLVHACSIVGSSPFAVLQALILIWGNQVVRGDVALQRQTQSLRICISI